MLSGNIYIKAFEIAGLCLELDGEKWKRYFVAVCRSFCEEFSFDRLIESALFAWYEYYAATFD